MPVRTISIPVAEVLEGGTKSEFYAELRKSLDIAVRAANLAATECLRQDDAKQDKPPKIYTYPIISSMFPGACAVAAAISRAVESSYKSDRWQVIRGIRASRSYRSFPWPLLHNASINTFTLDDVGGFLRAEIRLAGKRWVVRLAGGSQYRDQVRGLRAAVEGSQYGDSKIWIDRKHRAIVGVSCDIPVRAKAFLIGEMRVSSGKDHLLLATFDRSTVPFVINADACRQWQSEAARRCQRLRQDRKSDVDRRKIRRELNAISDKQNRRMKTLCHEVSAGVVAKAVRMRVATILLDLTIKSYADSFPWSDLAGKIKYKAESSGISVVDATQTVVNPDISKPHVYFKFAPLTNRIKIGSTLRDDGGRHGAETDSPEELTILAIDNQPKTKCRAREKHWQAIFAHCCDTSRSRVREWFHAEPILAWLREAQWLGNAGNLSQIMQVLDVSQDSLLDGHLQADRECSFRSTMSECSHNAESGEDIALSSVTALAVTNRTRRS